MQREEGEVMSEIIGMRFKILNHLAAVRQRKVDVAHLLSHRFIRIGAHGSSPHLEVWWAVGCRVGGGGAVW